MDSLIALLIGFGFGLAFAWFDKKKGNFWYRSWYKLTHKEALEEGSSSTFLQNQPFSSRIVPAIILSAVIGLVFYITGDLNVVMILIYMALIFVGIMASFYTFPFFTKQIQPQLEKVKDTIVKIDEIEASIKDKPNPEKIDDIVKEDPNNKEKEIPKDDKKDDKDWRSGVKDFLDK